MESDISVKVARGAIPEGTNLTDFVRTVNKAVKENFAFFGAKERWNLWTKEVFTDNVIVHVCDGIAPKFYKADMSMDSGGNITFSNLQEVEKVVTYVPKTVIEREEKDFEVIEVERGGLFDSVL
jgi:hypothetical protein